MKPLINQLVDLIARIIIKDQNDYTFSSKELVAIRALIKQNPILEDEFFHLKHSIYTATTSIGKHLKNDPSITTIFPEYFI